MKILIASTRELCYFSGSFFLDRIQEELERKNVEVVRLDFDENEADYSLLESQIGKTYDAILDVNSRLPYLIDNSGKRVLNEIDAPFVNYILDHPLYHHPGLAFPIQRYYTIGIDAFHVSYMKKYYPNVKDSFLLPLAGTRALECLPFAKRKKEILFLGTYLKDEILDEKILALRNQINNVTYKLALDLWDEWKDTAIPIEDSLMKILRDYSGLCEPKDIEEYICDVYEMSGFAELLNHMFLVDQKKRNLKREHILSELSEGTFPLSVMGEGWEHSVLSEKNGIRFLAPKSMAASIQLLGKYQMILDINPMFACGLHDRVTSAWINETVCITDMSLKFNENPSDGVNLISYNEKRILELNRKLEQISADELEAISQNGASMALKNYSWEAHAGNLIDIIEKINRT